MRKVYPEAGAGVSDCAIGFSWKKLGRSDGVGFGKSEKEANFGSFLKPGKRGL